jgi:hypothetical protein
MSTDPRLTNVALLTLAAYRIQQRRQHQVPDWRHTEGLASLLDAARHLPQRAPWSLPDLGCTPMGRLVAEARRVTEARRAAQGEP